MPPAPSASPRVAAQTAMPVQLQRRSIRSWTVLRCQAAVSGESRALRGWRRPGIAMTHELGRRSIRHQHFIDNHDNAVALHHVGARYLGGIPLLVAHGELLGAAG